MRRTPPWKHDAPMSRLHALPRRLTYANVVSTVCLFVLLGGTAAAARHYVITSTKQISPKVLKKLKGRRGLQGLPGSAGAVGATGAKGDDGAAGAKGATGAIGATGAKGDAGAPGDQGDQGDPGTAGAAGPSAFPGHITFSTGDNALNQTAFASAIGLSSTQTQARYVQALSPDIALTAKSFNVVLDTPAAASSFISFKLHAGTTDLGNCLVFPGGTTCGITLSDQVIAPLSVVYITTNVSGAASPSVFNAAFSWRAA